MTTRTFKLVRAIMVSSGIYLDGLFSKLGILDQAKPKLKPGGLVAEPVAKGETEIGVREIGEILPAKGATLVGPLLGEIENFATAATEPSAGSKAREPAAALLDASSCPSSNRC